MTADSTLNLSLHTLLGVAPLLGFPQEDRSVIRDRQQPDVVSLVTQESACRVAADLLNGFCVAPLDFLVSGPPEARRVHLLELNGSGIGGLTNLPEIAIAAILGNLRTLELSLPSGEPSVILVAASERESSPNPRQNRLLYEKVLYVDALRAGLAASGHAAAVCGLDALRATTPARASTALVLGYIRELMEAIELRDGAPWLAGRRVVAIVNDRLCLHAYKRLGGDAPPPFLAVNRCFVAGADKSVAYDVLDTLAPTTAARFPSVRPRWEFRRAGSRDALVTEIQRWHAERREPLLIKPQGTGLGHGIEFFLDVNASRATIEAAVTRSTDLTNRICATPGAAFPYTLCEYVDAATIPDAASPLFGHKFEMRIVVYRDGDVLRACPAIAKIASARWNPEAPTPSMLLNNITYSTEQSGQPGHRFILPLCNADTLESLGLSLDLVRETSRFATTYVAAALGSLAACGLTGAAPR